jgi:hypothetical protein
MLLLSMIPSIARGEEAPPATADSKIKTTVEAGEADAEESRRKLVDWNEFDGSVSTFRIGFGFLGDAGAYPSGWPSRCITAMWNSLPSFSERIGSHPTRLSEKPKVAHPDVGLHPVGVHIRVWRLRPLWSRRTNSVLPVPASNVSLEVSRVLRRL